MSLPIVPVILSADNNYAGYLTVCLTSLIAHITPEHQYNIYILDGGISSSNKDILQGLERPNVSINFVNMLPYINDENKNIFATTIHFSIATYHRFFLPDIFKQYDKVVYLDCDTVVLKDPAHLYNIDIGDNYLGATKDTPIIHSISSNINAFKKNTCPLLTYINKTLGIADYTRYFQAGCLLFNLKAMRQDDVTSKFLEKLLEIKTPKFVDQCIMNSVCYGKVFFIKQNWNFTWHTAIYDPNCFNNMPPVLGELYKQAAEDPWLIHYTGQKCKPTDQPKAYGASYFWIYAQQTPHYSQFLIDMVMAKNLKHYQATKNYQKLRLKNLSYKMLANLSTGRTKQKYADKLAKNKLHLANCKTILFG